MSKSTMSHGARGRGRTMRLTHLAAAFFLATVAACASPEQKVERYTKSGEEFLEKGDLGRANVQFQNALKIDEEHVPALLGVADIAERRQDFRAMVGILQRVVRVDPENVEGHVKLGKLRLLGGDETTALEQAEKALAIEPENADAIALKAAVLLKVDNDAEADALARRALEIDPANAEASAVVATVRAKAGDPQGAIDEIDRLLAIEPRTPVLHLLRLQLLANQDRRDELRAGYERLIELYPTEPGYRRSYAAFLTRWNETNAARAQLEAVVENAENKTDAVLDIVRLDYRTGGMDAAKKTFAGYAAALPNENDLQFAYGDFLRQQRDYAAAGAVYEPLTKRRDDREVARRAMSEIAGLRILEGREDEARSLIADILEEDERDGGALLKRAGLRIKDGQVDEAIADLRIVIADSPDSAPAKMLMGGAFEQKGDMEYAATQFAQAVEAADQAHGPSRAFASFLIRTDNPARAEQVLRAALDRRAGDVETLKLLATVQLMRQDWRGAEETAQRIRTADAGEASVDRILGAAYAGLGEYGPALEALTKAHEQTAFTGRQLAALVGAYINDGRAEEAERTLRGMIEQDADNYDARILLAHVLERQEKRDQMETVLGDAIEAAPARLEAVEILYRAYMTSDRREEAQRLVDERLAAEPEEYGLNMLKADYLLSTGRPEEAMNLYAEILERRPGDPLAANNYSSLLNQLRDDPESRARALEVAKVLEGSDNPYFLDTYGWALHRTGDHQRAIRVLETAAAGAPGLAEINYHLGAAYLAVGDKDKARAQLEKALEAGQTPYEDQARELLAQI